MYWIAIRFTLVKTSFDERYELPKWGQKRDIGETKIKLEFGQKSTTLKEPARIG